MFMPRKLIRTFLFLIVLSSCSKEGNYEDVDSQEDLSLNYSSEIDLKLLDLINIRGGTKFFMLPNDGEYSKIPQDPKNPITYEKVELGKLLVHETGTGASPRIISNLFTYSCASCHPVASSFFSGNKQGIGEGGVGFGFAGEGRIVDTSIPLDSVDILSIKVPTLLNAAYQKVMLSSGSLGGVGINQPHIYKGDNAIDIPDNLLAFEGLEVQGMGGQPEHGLLAFSKFLVNYPQYYELYDRAFPELEELERYSRESGGLAIAAYVRTLLANQSPWQDWLRGYGESMTDQEKRGAIVFMDKGRCVECHTGPALSSDGFYSFGFSSMKDSGGIINDEEDFLERERGRGDFTKNPTDDYKFKVPTLYNLKDSKFYGHGASFKSIRSVIEYKNNGVKQSANIPDSQLATQFGATNLTEQDVSDLTAFLENALYDSNIGRYAPNSVLSGNCIPNSDEQSKIDLGCN